MNYTSNQNNANARGIPNGIAPGFPSYLALHAAPITQKRDRAPITPQARLIAKAQQTNEVQLLPDGYLASGAPMQVTPVAAARYQVGTATQQGCGCSPRRSTSSSPRR